MRRWLASWVWTRIGSRVRTDCVFWSAIWFPAAPRRSRRPTQGTSSAGTCRGWGTGARWWSERFSAARPGAVHPRVAASHLRVGSFQYAAATGNLDLLRRLADHAIARHYPGVAMVDNPYLALFEAVAAVQASLVAQWMLLGFVHGVMNTDNMTISGETIDYGPCAFMEAYNPDTVFSSIDQWGRYAYDNQPAIAGWNLARFGEALLPLLADTVDEGIALAEKAFDVFRGQYDATWTNGMRDKLGLSAHNDSATVVSLVEDLLALLNESRVDYTSFFRGLSQAARGDAEPTGSLFINPAVSDGWICGWRAVTPDAAGMDRSNPVYIPRNHLVEEALTAATAGELDPLQQLLSAVTAPYDERPGLERYGAPAPESFGDYRTFCGT